LIVIAGIFLFVRNISGLKWIGFIAGYPAIILFWRIPKAIILQKSWILVFTAINAVVNFFRSFRNNIVITTIILSSFAVIFVFSEQTILSIAAVALLISILSIYMRTILSAFKPSTVYKFYTTVLPAVREHFKTTSALDAEIRLIPKENLDGQQLKLWASKLETPVLYNRLCLYVAKKFREYQQSPAPFVTVLLSAFSLFLLTVVVFAFINLSIYKIDTAAFEASEVPTFFTFIWYSFNHITANSIKELTPTSVIAKLAWMVEWFFSFLFASVVVSLLIAIKNQRNSGDIDGVIVALTNESQELEKFIKSEYQLDSLDSALKELDRLEASIIKIIMWLTNNIK
jgi:hypothetical protein